MSHWNDRGMADFKYIREKQVKHAFKLIFKHGEVCTRCQHYSYHRILGCSTCNAGCEKGHSAFLVRVLEAYSGCQNFQSKKE